MNINKDWKKWTVWIVIAAFSGWAGYLLNDHQIADTPSGKHGKVLAPSEVETLWTCSMHPQIKLPQKGICPICNMDLIPLKGAEGSNDQSGRTLHLSEYASALAEVKTEKAHRKPAFKEIRLVGKVTYNETSVKHISSWIAGRIDRLYVDYTGMNVRKGDHLYKIYSPELFSAQEEYLQSIENMQLAKKTPYAENVRRSEEIFKAIHEKLRLWGLSENQLEKIQNSKHASSHMTIYSPSEGTVIEKNVLEGEYVKTGTKLLTIADLSNVWVHLDAYESDISWLGYGNNVVFSTEAYPGDLFRGKIVFISPYLDNKTRTFNVRINVPNPDKKLKPEMFVNAIVKVRIGASGLPREVSLKGKWMCPMHPEIIKNYEDICDICEMRLEKISAVESFMENNVKKDPLVIPDTAPLFTGKRAIVYIKLPGREAHYEGREVVLGPRVSGYYVVKNGIEEDEAVVVSGNFKIDSALQIIAKPSMMNATYENTQVAKNGPMEGDSAWTHIGSDNIHQMMNIYLDLQKSLSRDNLIRAKESGAQLSRSLKENKDEYTQSYPHFSKWGFVMKSAENIFSAKDIETARKNFYDISEGLIELFKNDGRSILSSDIYVYHCPMAFEFKGARWLQGRKGVENPYFGERMFKCGTLVDTINPGKEDKKGGNEHKH